MNSIRAQLPGTTVVEKLNQGSPRPLGGFKRSAPFLPARLWHSGGGSLAPVLTKEVGAQKGTKDVEVITNEDILKSVNGYSELFQSSIIASRAAAFCKSSGTKMVARTYFLTCKVL